MRPDWKAEEKRRSEARLAREAEERRQRLELVRRDIGRSLFNCETLEGFVREAWSILEPNTDYVHGWHITALCVPGETEVLTEAGPKRIDEIVNTRWAGKVLSLNHESGQTEWRSIVRHINSPRGSLLALRTASGLRFRATENHPIFVVGKGYVRADQVVVGDRIIEVHALQRRVRAEEVRQGDVLQPGVPLRRAARAVAFGRRGGLPLLRKAVSSLPRAADWRLLFARVFRTLKGQARDAGLLRVRGEQVLGGWDLQGLLRQETAQGTFAGVRPLRSAGPSVSNPASNFVSYTRRFLQSRLSRSLRAWAEQRSLCRRSPTGDLWQGMVGRKGSDLEAGQPDLFPLSGDGEAGRSPHRPQQGQPRGLQLSDAVPDVSRHAASTTTGVDYGTVEGVVAAIGREVRVSDALYNLEVEGNHNFFADGVLTHNCDHLEAVTDGRINRLLINVPPGSSKSLIVSVLWPAWEWGPKGLRSMRYLTTSFSDDSVKRDTRKMRDLVMSEWYQARWPEVVLTRTGETSFANTATGNREGSPFGSLTSKRGDRLIIDDPHSTETAESPAERLRTTRKFREGATNRLNDQNRSAIVVIMQRLHAQDISGVILALEMGYCHLEIPMEFEVERRTTTAIGWTDPRLSDGDLMDPIRFPRAVVDALKRDMGSYAFAGQYQQRPSPRTGGLFAVERILVVKALPAGKRKTVRAWDFAASLALPGKDPDWTVGIRMSRGDDGLIYIEDMIRFRNTAGEVKKVFITTARNDGTEVWVRFPQDPGQAGKDQMEDRSRALAGFRFTVKPVTGAKEDRATPFANQVEAGNVRMYEASWNNDLLEELRAFPSGKHDDVVDAAADAFTELAGVVPGEGLLEFYRQEAAKAALELRGEQAYVSDADKVMIKGPPTIGMCTGTRGQHYYPDAAGVFHVHPEDAPALLRQMGWSKIEEASLMPIEALEQYVQYIRNTALVPLPTAFFDDDWDPIGPTIRRQMVRHRLTEEDASGLRLIHG